MQQNEADDRAISEGYHIITICIRNVTKQIIQSFVEIHHIGGKGGRELEVDEGVWKQKAEMYLIFRPEREYRSVSITP